MGIIINTYFFYDLTCKIKCLIDKFYADDTDTYKQYMFDTTTCTSYYWIVNALNDFAQISIFYYVVHKFDKKINEIKRMELKENTYDQIHYD